MDLNDIERQLVLINEKLQKPFPYRDTDKIQEDYSNAFSKLSDDDNWLTADFNTYCMNIAGTLSYVLIGKSNKIPKGQIEMLRFSFFEFFKQYRFFEDNITQYDGFYQEYMDFEKARKLLLQYLSTYMK
ncbi:YxiJ-like family protein [Lysinibacillus endophyticus]|uniref:YxiJ-like family protein n=1 Tax=Ureibacillus endophyticus TaxID=1978490 RepID=UPI00209E0E99|nr:YxiJ-like family protein [Lysinibacillus endophyticus]MCP1146088.1 YxiJ-like family protein [Lysinibacillus endophyticus]